MLDTANFFQDFVCPVNGDTLYGKLEVIKIPLVCPNCNKKVILDPVDNPAISPDRPSSILDHSVNGCNRFSTYELIWQAFGLKSKSEKAIEYGVNCSKCREYNQYAEKKDGFVCYGCRSGF